jgi:hypothetical protein
LMQPIKAIPMLLLAEANKKKRLCRAIISLVGFM